MFIRDMRIRMRAKSLPALPSQDALIAADIVASTGTPGAPNTNGWDHLFSDAVSIHGADEEEWETTSYEEAELMATRAGNRRAGPRGKWGPITWAGPGRVSPLSDRFGATMWKP
jgi:hypothetical protein